MSPDVIVVGGGHNGLAAAARLAGEGRSVCLLEARDTVGGVAGGEAFHPGFRHSGLLHDSDTLRRRAVDLLGLRAHGLRLREPPPVYALRAGGGGALLHADPARSELGDDALGWLRLRAFLSRLRPFAASVLDAPPPVVGAEGPLGPLLAKALDLRRLGQREMMALLRVGPTCVDDWVGEYLEDPVTRAAAMMPALLGTWAGPRSPMTTALLLFHAALEGQEVAGGPAALVAALEAACRARGVTIRTGAEVVRIRVEEGAARGVDLSDGTALDAPVVLAALGPRRALLDLVDPAQLPALIERDLARVRVRGAVAKVHLALSAPPEIDGQVQERIRVVEGPLHLERAFDDVKYRRLPSQPPPLDVRIPSIGARDLAPAGAAVASILVFGVPHDLEGGWTAAARAEVLEQVLLALGAHLPDLRDRVLGHEVLVPPDLEARYGLEGGHLFHGEHALDQLWALRPTVALARHQTPVRGLYLGASGSHPGGGITCGPGLLAAQALLDG